MAPMRKASNILFFKKTRISINKVVKLGHKNKSQIGRNPTINSESKTNIWLKLKMLSKE